MQMVILLIKENGHRKSMQKKEVSGCWKIWCKALGNKAFSDNKDADKVAYIRTSWALLNIITCICIIVNCIHQW